MEERAAELIKRGSKLFEDRRPLLSLWQEIADQFYPMRADFTSSRSLGTEFAAHLSSSFPTTCHRDLAAFISASRPADIEWAKVSVKDDRLKEDGEVSAWCGFATTVMHRAKYDPVAKFTRATKEGDRDFAAFGQCGITVEMNVRTQALLYRSWHLRDFVWTEGPEGDIDTVHRDWKPTARNLVKEFGRSRMHPAVLGLLDTEPHKEVHVRHVVMPAEDWDWSKRPRNARRFPFVCLYVDVQNQHIIEEAPLVTFPWVIPRWETVSGSQYAFSPAAIVSVPDARLLQAQMLVILESGEKAVDPPLIAKQEIFRSDVNLFSGGLTYADIESDQNLNNLVVPLIGDPAGLRLGMELAKKSEELLAASWYLNRIFLPAFDPGEKMTAYEVSKRSEEAYRAAVTLFEPIEAEYNARLCSTTFDLLMAHGAFGDIGDMPDVLSKKEVEFTFESPLKQARGRADVTKFGEASQLTAVSTGLKQDIGDNFDVETAYRDAVRGLGANPKWLRDPKAIEKLREDRAKMQQMAQLAQTMNAGAEVAGNVGEAAMKLREGLAPVQ